jgi:uncharacterized protein YndB with AHSA1/START domain
MSAEMSTTMAGDTDDLLHLHMERVLDAPVSQVWEVLVGSTGSQALLGAGAVLGAKGEPYHCADGVYGVVRSYHPWQQLRVSWHETSDAPPSIVELELRGIENGAATVIELRHDRITDSEQYLRLQTRWKTGLDSLSTVLRG